MHFTFQIFLSSSRQENEEAKVKAYGSLASLFFQSCKTNMPTRLLSRFQSDDETWKEMEGMINAFY